MLLNLYQSRSLPRHFVNLVKLVVTLDFAFDKALFGYQFLQGMINTKK